MTERDKAPVGQEVQRSATMKTSFRDGQPPEHPTAHSQKQVAYPVCRNAFFIHIRGLDLCVLVTKMRSKKVSEDLRFLRFLREKQTAREKENGGRG